MEKLIWIKLDFFRGGQVAVNSCGLYGTPGRIRTCDLLLRRQTTECDLVDSLSFFFGLDTWSYGMFGRYCSLLVP